MPEEVHERIVRESRLSSPQHRDPVSLQAHCEHFLDG